MDYSPLIGQRVLVFRNPSNDPYWEAAAKVDNKWKVLHKSDYFVLTDAIFTVHKVIKLPGDPVKVHAWVDGTLGHLSEDEIIMEGIRYNPNENFSFVTRKEGKPIFRAKLVVFNKYALWIDKVPKYDTILV